jgi:hypothetical protein
MIKRFNDWERVDEKWGMEYIIPILISMGLVSQSQAQVLTPNEINQIIKDNPKVYDIIENKKTVKECIDTLNECKTVLMFLDNLDDHSQENIRKKIEVSNIEPSLQQKMIGFFSGSGVYQVPKLGTFVEMWANIGKGTSVGVGQNFFGKNIGLRKTINWD